MTHLLADRRDVEFVVHEQFNTGMLSDHDRFNEFNKKTIDLILSEARNLALKEVVPTNKEGDEEGCRYENGKVIIPESFHRIWKLYRDGEWIAMSEDPEWGGQGMPKILSAAATEYLNGANCAMFMYAALTHGAANLVENFGTDEQKKLYLKKMYSGEWTGTMLLTEANAGSDVGALETVAQKNDDGTYSITGNKIFISGGEHEMAANIIHPVLARIEGAPAGTKGISLFLVPKYRVNPDGSIGLPNDVVCTGIEHKMGIHGNCTCSLALGGKGECIGTLLGEENKGMRAMFLMMNEARLYVGIQGLSLAAAAYANAVSYAKERKQGAHLLSILDKDAPAVPIIQHPDIRRQLMIMKAYVEGIRSLIYYISFCFDRIVVADTEEQRETLRGIIDVLIPVAKGFVTDKAFEICSHGMQVYGGYGFVEEYPQAQLLRDCRITMLYEGTNGIQAMDLLGRKLGMKKGQPLLDLFSRMSATIFKTKEQPAVKHLAEAFEPYVTRLGEVALKMGTSAMSADVLHAFTFAHPFMEVLGDVVTGWMLLWRANVAASKIESAKKDKDFYEGQIKSAQWFIESALPVTAGKMNAIETMSKAAVDMPEGAFNA